MNGERRHIREIPGRVTTIALAGQLAEVNIDMTIRAVGRGDLRSVKA